MSYQTILIYEYPVNTRAIKPHTQSWGGCVIVCLSPSLTHVSVVAHCCLRPKEGRLCVCVKRGGACVSIVTHRYQHVNPTSDPVFFSLQTTCVDPTPPHFCTETFFFFAALFLKVAVVRICFLNPATSRTQWEVPCLNPQSPSFEET